MLDLDLDEDGVILRGSRVANRKYNMLVEVPYNGAECVKLFFIIINGIMVIMASTAMLIPGILRIRLADVTEDDNFYPSDYPPPNTTHSYSAAHVSAA